MSQQASGDIPTYGFNMTKWAASKKGNVIEVLSTVNLLDAFSQRLQATPNNSKPLKFFEKSKKRVLKNLYKSVKEIAKQMILQLGDYTAKTRAQHLNEVGRGEPRHPSRDYIAIVISCSTYHAFRCCGMSVKSLSC